jgi:hypothetical protein
MSQPASDNLAAGYEALRAQALGDLPTESPRGLAVILSQGLPGWMRAWAAPSSVPPAPVPTTSPPAGAGLGAEVVRLLTEMTLGGGRRLAIS